MLRRTVRSFRSLRGLLLACGLAVALTAALAPSSPATGGSPPQFKNPKVLAYSTRANVVAQVGCGALNSMTWTGEVAPAEPGGTPPPEGSPAWTVENENVKAECGFEQYLPLGSSSYPGAAEPDGYAVRHLAPQTAYYARFIVQDAEGKAVETVPFTTLALAKPEIPPNYAEKSATGHPPAFSGAASSSSTAKFKLQLESNGSETTYHVEYAAPENGHAPATNSPSWTPFATDGTGTITPSQEFIFVEPEATGLAPETTYYARVRATNIVGEVILSSFVEHGKVVSTFTTQTAKPAVDTPVGLRNIGTAEATAQVSVAPHRARTVWRLESASSASGPWTVVPGGSGEISQPGAEALGYGGSSASPVRLSGLAPSTTSFLRVTAENFCEVGCGVAVGPVASFQTSGAPSATALETHALRGESVRLLGEVNPNSEITQAEQVLTLENATSGTFTLTYSGQTTTPIAHDTTAEEVRHALRALESPPALTTVEGLPGGPYTLVFSAEAGAQPALEVNGSALNAGANGTVTIAQAGGGGLHADYHFQYVSAEGFAAHGWSEAAETAPADAGAGNKPVGVGADLPGLVPGEIYRYRLVAANGAPGTAPVVSAEQTLRAPVAAAGSGGGSCPNEAQRSGASAALPDCRAFELLSPADKEGAQEPWHYQQGTQPSYLFAGEDGEHALLQGPGVQWGNTGQSPYLFSRQSDGSWSKTVGTPQPQTGPALPAIEISSADATQIAFKATSDTSPGHLAPVEYAVGPVGGPYTAVASIPEAEENNSTGWVAGTRDLSKLVFSTAERTLAGQTVTKSGNDLYEYTAAEGLRQLNVNSEGETLGRCGAVMALGREEGGSAGVYSSVHSISEDGKRVFFEAAPAANCSEPSHLYMRVEGATTVDIGQYRFVAADAQGTKLLLSRGESETETEYFLYDTETATTKHLFNAAAPTSAVVSADLSAVFVTEGKALYRYDMAGETLRHVLSETVIEQAQKFEGHVVDVIPIPAEPQVSADGRYYYFQGGVAGLPGAGVIRYDSLEQVAECISCSLSSDPEPALPAFLSATRFDGVPFANGGYPEYRSITPDGSIAVFETPAALVPRDANGEIEPETFNPHSEYFDAGDTITPSTDVYEWRRDGVDGCAQLQGCVALISDGRKGYHVDLLGIAHEGRDIYFYTRSQLLPADVDNAGDIYDARINGGAPPPPPAPVECEGDACSSAPPAPQDVTPASLTFMGAGNALLAPPPVAAPHKPVVRAKCTRRTRRTRRCKARRRAQHKSSQRTVRKP